MKLKLLSISLCLFLLTSCSSQQKFLQVDVERMEAYAESIVNPVTNKTYHENHDALAQLHTGSAKSYIESADERIEIEQSRVYELNLEEVNATLLDSNVTYSEDTYKILAVFQVETVAATPRLPYKSVIELVWDDVTQSIVELEVQSYAE